MLVVERYAQPIIDRWRRGAQGEEYVDAILDGMRDDGWFAIHDVSVGHGNIDHIVIGPAGIFTIETKSHHGRINSDRIESRMLKQAYAEAKLVERITGMKVHPLLVFSRAYLIPAICRRAGSSFSRTDAPGPPARLTFNGLRGADGSAARSPRRSGVSLTPPTPRSGGH